MGSGCNADAVKKVILSFHGKPISKARPRFCRKGNYVGTYKPRAEAEREEYFKMAAKEQMKHYGLYEPFQPGTPIAVTYLFEFTPPSSFSKKKRAESYGKSHIKKPDLDNLIKFAQDAMNGIAWADDSQVSRSSAEKRYAEEERTVIVITLY